jgi:triosephosphate isomerase
MPRVRYIAGNWKMNQTTKEIDAFVAGIKDLTGQDCQTWIAPQFVHIPYLIEQTKDMPWLKVGAQNCSAELKGAFTGDISLSALKDVGADFVIIGHSERRAIFGETHELLNRKVKLAENEGMTTIFCIGETLEERESGNTNAVVEEQLLKGLA